MERQRILLVDDAAETRQFLASSILEPEGYEVKTAGSSQEALSILAAFQPDLIISDYLMPGQTGLELLEALHAQKRLIPFILITAEGSETLAVRALRLGVRNYLNKPFEIDDFLAAIRDALPAAPVQSPFWEAAALILLLDAEQRLLFYNHTAMQRLGLSPQATGKPLAQVVQQSDLVALSETESAIVPRRSEINISDRTYNAEVTVLPDQRRLIIMQDVTHYKEMDRIKSDFVATVSHDLRSPLTTILGYVDLLGRIGPLNEQQKQYTNHIVFSVKSITALLSDLLDLSKIEAGFDTTQEPTPMEIIVRYALEATRTELEAQKHQLKVEINQGVPQVVGNPVRLKQVATNLVQNAIKYTPAGGNIQVRLYNDDGFVVFQVKDSGIGIKLEDQPYIFDKFYRTDEAADNFPGTGLGLSIVKTIVDAHQGRIWVESTPGQGSTFTVMLPGKKEA